jgi:hypothetical protein
MVRIRGHYASGQTVGTGCCGQIAADRATLLAGLAEPLDYRAREYSLFREMPAHPVSSPDPPGPKGAGQDARSIITCVVPSRYGVFSARRTSPHSVSDSRLVATGGRAT